MRGLGSGTPPSLMARRGSSLRKSAESIQRQHAQRRLPQRHRDALGKAREEPAVERVVGKVGGACGGAHVAGRIPKPAASCRTFTALNYDLPMVRARILRRPTWGA